MVDLEKIDNGAYDNDPLADSIRVGFDKVNDNFLAVADLISKVGRDIFLGYAAENTNVDVFSVAARMNARTNTITEKECPVLVLMYSSRIYEGDFYYSTTAYPFIFKRGAGKWGAGADAAPVNSAMFTQLAPIKLTPEDLEANLSVKIEPLGVIPAGQTFIDVANASNWNWTDSGSQTETGVKQYYFRYTVEGELVFAFFKGTPGNYGPAGVPFTSAMFDESKLATSPEKTKLSEFENDKQFQTLTEVDSKISTAVSTVYRGQGDWNASGGQYPSTGSLGQAVQANFTYNVSVAGTMQGEDFDKGDTFYAKVDNPGQDPLKWGRFESNTQQATDTYRGTVLILSGPGTSTTGTMTQKAITDLSATKANRDGSNAEGMWNEAAKYWGGREARFSDFGGLLGEIVGIDGISGIAQRYSHEQVKESLGVNAKADLVAGKVPASQLPSFVDDVLEYANVAAFPVTGESGKIYVTLDTNLTYRWSGSAYVEISKSIALGETSATAYRGDRGKTAYDHANTTGNPHNTQIGDIPDLAETIDGILAGQAYAVDTSYTGGSGWFSTLNSRYPGAAPDFKVIAVAPPPDSSNVLCVKLADGQWMILQGVSGIVSGS